MGHHACAVIATSVLREVGQRESSLVQKQKADVKHIP